MQQKYECACELELAEIVATACHLVPTAEYCLLKCTSESFLHFIHLGQHVFVQKDIVSAVAFVFPPHFIQMLTEKFPFLIVGQSLLKTTLNDGQKIKRP